MEIPYLKVPGSSGFSVEGCRSLVNSLGIETIPSPAEESRISRVSRRRVEDPRGSSLRHISLVLSVGGPP
jgi:hypothetical protein